MNLPANVQESVASEVNSRLERATHELQAKYASGRGGVETSLDGPTGTAYQEKRSKELQAKKLKKEKLRQQRLQNQNQEDNQVDLDSDLDDDDEGEGENNELQYIREQRLKQIKIAQNEKLENLSKGHGQYREILQDEFLNEVTGSVKVVCHFYHRDFPRCEIMDHHLQKLSLNHIECKFIKINADKAPFFIEKLRIRTIPTVVIFHDGVAVDKILGFEGLTDGLPAGKEDEWPTIRLARLLVSKGAINKSTIKDEDEIAKEQALQLESMRKALLAESILNLDDDLDNEDDDIDLLK
eukprot:gene4643-4975_t